ncbi:porin family protein [Aridibaculum aurantiacum]|uniref:porin family protein n=1 Tax=Aridibaculum aurantiacum TaxID=2810307 RepID=UPI001A96827A|nr:porin family protein [Aridibaculum aurantiacum]
MQSLIKSITAVLLFMTVSIISSAQSNRFSISLNSLTTNFNYGKSNTALEPYKKNYKGFQAGFSYQAGISPMFSVVPELYFAVKGGRLKENNPLTGSKSTLRVNSLEIPVLARLHCNKLYLNAGPYAGYNVGGRLKIDGTNTSPETTEKVSFGNSSADFKRWDFGFQAGAGYNFNLKQSVLTLDVRYGYGLVNFSRDIERYNRMLNISVQVSRPGRKTEKHKQG